MVVIPRFIFGAGGNLLFVQALGSPPKIYYTNLSCTYHPPCSVGVTIKELSFSLRHQETSTCSFVPRPHPLTQWSGNETTQLDDFAFFTLL